MCGRYGVDCSLKHCEGVKVVKASEPGGYFTNAMETEQMNEKIMGTRVPCRFLLEARAGTRLTLGFPYAHLPG